MEIPWSAVYGATAFLGITATTLVVVLTLNHRMRPGSRDRLPAATGIPKALDPAAVLGWEFEYARTTASEAMQDRHTMVNFYLLAVGVALTGVLAILSRGADLPRAAGTLLLWMLCGVGWIYFLSIIRLRQAWCDSAQAMSWIKEFYIEHSQHYEPAELKKAFLWKGDTIPRADKPFTVFFYSAMLIGFLNSLAFLGGASLLAMDPVPDEPAFWTVFGWLLVLSVAYFALHLVLYFAFLRERKDDQK